MKGMTVVEISERIVQTWAMADVDSQRMVAGLLRGRVGLRVDTVEGEDEPRLVVRCASGEVARWVFEFVLSVDVGAELMHVSPAGAMPDHGDEDSLPELV